MIGIGTATAGGALAAAADESLPVPIASTGDDDEEPFDFEGTGPLSAATADAFGAPAGWAAELPPELEVPTDEADEALLDFDFGGL